MSSQTHATQPIPTASPSRAGFTLIELIVVTAVIGILSAMATPLVLRARASANEASAVQSLRTLVSAQSTFSTVCGNSGYTLSLTKLVTDQFASPDLDITPKSGYSFQLVASVGSMPAGPDCTGQPTQNGFYFRAEPLSGNSGNRGFAVNHEGTIWQNTAGTAPAEPFAATPTITPLDEH